MAMTNWLGHEQLTKPWLFGQLLTSGAFTSTFRNNLVDFLSLNLKVYLQTICSIHHQLITGMLERLRNWALCSTLAPFPSFRPCYARVFLGLSCYFSILKSFDGQIRPELNKIIKISTGGGNMYIACLINHWHLSKFRMFYLGVPMIYIAIFRTRQVHAATSLGVIKLL